jgi:putative membrane protein insertion efficiency factor
MGHCDSPARFGRYREILVDNRRAVEVDSAQDHSGTAEGVSGNGQSGIGSAIGSALLAFLRIYKSFLSPFFGGACKYDPSCSNYAYQAIHRHGARRGAVLALKRLGRCRPFVQGGLDPVPTQDELNVGRQRACAAEPLR